MFYKLFKRVFDTVLSFLLIIILLPLFLFLGILIVIDSKGPIIFAQERIGRNKKHFKIYKYRTLKIGAPKDVPTHLFLDIDKWTTKVGMTLRRTKLDEIPQLFNILKGDMSLIGPRPALWNQFDLIEERDKYGVNSIYPGLTGWAQISSKEEQPISRKVELDSYYLNHMNILFDIKIALLTIFKCYSKKDL
jgi:O-antigen biosynthesis protein WbqP